MDEAELTRKAVEEIMREMNAQNEADKIPQVLERKRNPLRKPNKDFLDRTLNSVMAHNKRQLERNRRKCQDKLRDIDEARAGEKFQQRGRDRSRMQRKKKLKRRNSRYPTSSSSSSNSSLSKERPDKPKKYKGKKKRTKKRIKSKLSSPLNRSTSSLSVDSSTSSSSSSCSKRNRKRQKKLIEVEGQQEHPDPSSTCYYVNPSLAWAAMAFSHMDQVMQQQQAVQALLSNMKDERNKNDYAEQDIPSDLSLTYHSSESELNISINSSSAEEDENGVLTFKLISDEERTSKRQPTKTHRKRKSLISRNERSHSSQSNTTRVTISDSTSESDETSAELTPENRDQITIISSSSNGESDQDIDKRQEYVTTILSSSSSEEDGVENAMRKEEVTILSSSSDAEEIEQLDAKDRKESDSTDLNKNEITGENVKPDYERIIVDLSSGNESDANKNNEEKNQEKGQQTVFTENNDVISTADNAGQVEAKVIDENALLIPEAQLKTTENEDLTKKSLEIKETSQAKHDMEMECHSTGLSEVILNSCLANSDNENANLKTNEREEQLKESKPYQACGRESEDVQEQKEGEINTLKHNRVAELNQEPGEKREIGDLYQGQKSKECNDEEIVNKKYQEQRYQTLLCQGKDLKSTDKNEKQVDNRMNDQISMITPDLETIGNEELSLKIDETSDPKNDKNIGCHTISISEVKLNSYLILSDNEGVDGLPEANPTLDDTSDIFNLKLNEREEKLKESNAYQACGRESDDATEKVREDKKLTDLCQGNESKEHESEEIVDNKKNEEVRHQFISSVDTELKSTDKDKKQDNTSDKTSPVIS